MSIRAGYCAPLARMKDQESFANETPYLLGAAVRGRLDHGRALVSRVSVRFDLRTSSERGRARRALPPLITISTTRTGTRRYSPSTR